MLSNALTDYVPQEIDLVGQGENSFTIEVHKNYVTIDRKHPHTSLIESKTIKVDKDVIVTLYKKAEDVYKLECKWLWRNPTVFDNLTREEATQLRTVINKLANSLRSLATANKTLPAIKIGKQVWAKVDIDIDMGIESRASEANCSKNSVNRLYTYTGAERVAANFPNWRIPTVEDYQEMMDYLYWGLFKELTGPINFGFYGFASNSISDKDLKAFQQMNRALQANNGGFYWTSDIEGYDPEYEQFGKRKYIYLNRFTQKVNIEESVNMNDNLFSLRLIHKKRYR